MATEFPVFVDVPEGETPAPGTPDADAAYLNSVNGAINTLENTVPGKVDAGELATVATSGAYTDLIGTPYIPTVPGDIGAQPAGDYVTPAELAPVATSGAYADLTGTPTIPPSYTDEQVRDVVGTALVGGTNISVTPNDAGDTITVDTTYDFAALETDVQNLDDRVAAVEGNVGPPNTQTGNTYTLTLADAGKTVEMDTGLPNTVTIPANSAVPYPVGTTVEVCQYGAGRTKVAPAAAVTLQAPAGTTLAGRFASVRLRKRAVDGWVLNGDTVSASPDTVVYGPGFQMDDLGNMQVGGDSDPEDNIFVAYYFIAAATSPLNSVQLYIIDESSPGYGGGTGGTLRISVQGDSNGFPDGTDLASVDVVGPEGDFPTYVFPTPATLQQGRKYHLVFTNVDPSPKINFVSVDLTWTSIPQTPRQYRWTDAELGVTRKFGTTGSWEFTDAERRHTPIFKATYANGVTQGQGYMERSTYEPDQIGHVTGSLAMVRERFTVSGGARTVSGVGIRPLRVSGTDPLIITLENSSGTLIDSASIPAASIAVGPDDDTGYNAVMVTAPFAQTRTLLNGQEYRLRLSTASGTIYKAFVIKKGTDYGFTAPTYFADGYAEKTSDGSSWTSLGYSAERNDLQFYLW
ncbi:MAG TPA: hypothetical protein VD834_16655 [Blastococcus sp.]|nr:hypothetical protein [Blastococcus sp.]